MPTHVTQSDVDNSTLEVSANTVRVKDGGITLAKLADAVADLIPYPDVTVGSEATNIIPVTVQMKDANGNNYTAVRNVYFTMFFSSSSASVVLHSTPVTSLAAGASGTKHYEPVAGKLAVFVSNNNNGVCNINVEYTGGAGTWYAWFEVGGRIYGPHELTFV